MKEVVTTKCPKCGENLTITVSNDSKSNATQKCSCGVAMLPNKADERIAALKKAGVDVSNLFAMQNASGVGMVVRLVKGIPTAVEDDDPIYHSILKNGAIPDRRLFRRWVMSQMFHMMTEKEYITGKPIGFTAALHNKGYEYQWKMVLEEMRVQEKLYRKDYENYQERNTWFNKDVVLNMCKAYMQELNAYMSTYRVTYYGFIYVHGRSIAVSDVPSLIITPLNRALLKVSKAYNPKSLYEALKAFNDLRVLLPKGTKQISEWVDAYKGAGAFYTLQNLIRFHNCVVREENGRWMSQSDSMEELSRRARMYCKSEGWRMFAFMKKVMEDNKVNLQAKMQEWRKN